MKKRIILVAIFLVMITTLSIIILNSEISYSKISKNLAINPLAPEPSSGNLYEGVNVSATEDDNVIATLDEEGILTISGIGRVHDDDNIASNWPEYNEQIKMIVIEEGVINIGDYFFCGLSYFKSITIPESVTEIGKEVFYECNSLTEIKVSCNSYAHNYYKGSAILNVINHTEVVDSAVSATCTTTGLTEGKHCSVCNEVLVAQEVIDVLDHSYGEWVVDKEATYDEEGHKYRVCINCNTEEEEIIPKLIGTWNISATSSDNVTATLYDDGRFVISGTGEMKDFTYNSVPWNGIEQQIKNVEIKLGVINIGNYAFYECSMLENVEIPEGVRNIGDYAFNRCSSLISIEIPSSVTRIESLAFYKCNSLKSVKIPESVGIMEVNIFSDCNSLIEIWVYEDSYAYEYVQDKYSDKLKIIEDIKTWDLSATESDNVKARGYDDGKLIITGTGSMITTKLIEDIVWKDYRKNIKDIIIQDGVTSIESNVFWGCSSLISVKIPSSITSIKNDIFDGNSNLTEIWVYEDSDVYKYLREKYNDRLKIIEDIETWDISATASDNVKIALYDNGTVVVSGNGAMEDYIHVNYRHYDVNSVVKKVIIKDGVTRIGSISFKYGNGIISIEIPASVTSIGEQAFRGCENLRSVEIASGVTSIEAGAFEACTSLTSIEIPSSVTSIGNTAFDGCSSLTSIEIPSSVTSIGNYAFDGCSSLTSIEIPSSVTSIGHSAFYDCSSLTSIEIPEGVTSIGDRDFYGCSSLTSIEIPSSVTSIGDRAFYGCSSLTSIEIPSSVTNIGKEVFSNCIKLAEIWVHEGSYAHEYVQNDYSDKLNVIEHTEEIYKEVAATCTTTGLTEGKYCSVCSEILVAQEVVPATGHDYKIKSKTDAVCEQGGEIVYECTKCKDTYTETVPALGHTEVVDSAVVATCTSTGLTEGKHCSVCNEVLVAQEVVLALGHTEVVDSTVAATCTTAGKTEGKHCSVCSEILVAQEEVPALGHTEVVDSAVAATCTSTGLTEGKHCSVCSEILVAQEVVPALGHTEVVDSAVAATCTSTGLTEGKHCSVCSEILVAQEVVPALGHTEVVDSAVAATCTTAGKTEGKHCLVCSEILVAQEVVPATGHDYKIKSKTDEVCEQGGEIVYECTKCKDTYTETVVALGHNWSEWKTTKEATCIEEGSKEKICSTCQEKETQTIELLEHSYSSEWTIDRQPTCTEEGSQSRHCIKCNNSKIEISIIDPTGHSFGEWIIDKEPTYEEEGHKYRICVNCNTEKEEQVIPVLIKEELEVKTNYKVKEADNVKYVMTTPKANVKEVLKNITSNQEIKVIDKNGKELGADALVGTGAKIVTKKDNKEVYTVVLTGDVNCDGKITFNDIIRTNAIRINQGENTISKAELFAADIDNTNKVEFRDIISINAIRINNL